MLKVKEGLMNSHSDSDLACKVTICAIGSVMEGEVLRG